MPCSRVSTAPSDNLTNNFFDAPLVFGMSFPLFFAVSFAYLAFLPFADFFGDQLTFAVAFCLRLVTTASS